MRRNSDCLSKRFTQIALNYRNHLLTLFFSFFCYFDSKTEVKMDGWPAYEPVAKYLETSEKRRLLLLIGMVTTMYQLLTSRSIRTYLLPY